MRIEDAYFTAQILGFTAGTVLFVLLSALLWKARRLTGEPWYGMAMAVLGLLWNAASLVKHLEILMRVSPGYRPFDLTAAFAWTAAVMLPTSFFLVLRPAHWASLWRMRLAGWFLWVSYALAIGLTLGFFIVVLAPNAPLPFVKVMRLS